MLRLRLAGIPIEVHSSHVILVPLVAFVLVPKGGWAAHAPAVLVAGLTGAIISGTLLLHELGHAFAARAFGYRPVVQLIALRGRTLPNPNETMPWQREVAIHLAGPAMGITLGFACASLWYPLKHGTGVLAYALQLAAATQLIWAAVSLLPVHPLDGGRIATALAQRAFGRDGYLYAQLLGVVTGTVVAASSLAYGLWVGVLALVYVAQSAVLIIGFRRGQLPVAARHPLEEAFAHAEGLYRDDNVEEAERVARPLLSADLQPELRSHVHVLLGWVSLKRGRGRAALDHFSQSPGAQVPPQALAAAFSLIGDDVRAAPLWEQAAQATKDPTLIHEYSGALIRLGRLADVRRLPNLHLPAAWQAAERVYLARDDFEGAARIAEARFAAEPSAATAYTAACRWAQAQKPDDAMRLLAAAAQHGFDDLARALSDEALSPLRAHAGYIAFLEGLRAGPRN
ncbi:MAG: peptidase M50 [Myxococcaceae bacterium]|nr:peptidase M50 [Myxococcaceae bacterium]